VWSWILVPAGAVLLLIEKYPLWSFLALVVFVYGSVTVIRAFVKPVVKTVKSSGHSLAPRRRTTLFVWTGLHAVGLNG
jgi:hypothetical protein